MKRLEYADIAKGLAIIAVVLAHVNLSSTPGREWMFVNVCYAFHMPFFFLLGGLFLKPRASYDLAGWRKFLVKNFLSLMVPYFLWGIIYMPFSYTNIAKMGYGSWLGLKAIGTQTALWFLPVMFLGRVYCEAIFNLASRLKVRASLVGAVSVPVFLALGLLLPHNNTVEAGGNFWGYDIAFVAAAFLMLGAIGRPLFDRLATARFPVHLALFAGFTALFVISFRAERPLLTLGVNHVMMMCNASYGPWAYFLANALTGSAAVLALAMCCVRLPLGKSVLAFLGANTMGIYLLHKNIFPELKLLIGQGEFLSFGWALVLTVLNIPICLLIMHFLSRLAPRLLGKSSGQAAAAVVKDVFSVALCEDVLGDGKIDFEETTRIIAAVRPLADAKGGAYTELVAKLERARADGVITPEESKEIAVALEDILMRMKNPT